MRLVQVSANALRVNESDFAGAARELEIPPAAVMAVNEAEAPNGGFDPDGRPRILFEGLVFRRKTGGRLDKIAPALAAAFEKHS